MQIRWRPRPADQVVRRPRAAELKTLIFRLPLPRPPERNIASPLTVLYGFAFLVVIGTALLMLPYANTLNEIPRFNTALFTATSAVTVTGLTVVDTPGYWTPLGQGVILVLILIGGMGWMTLAGIVLVIIGQRITLPQRMALRGPLGVSQIGGVVRLLRNMVITALGLQLLGALLLTVRLHERFSWDWPKALWQGSFHAVAAFNNAGFAILPSSNNLSALHDDFLFLGTLAVLIMLGGLSFFVILELMRTRRQARLSLDTKIVVVFSLILWVLGTVVIFAFEFGNSTTLGQTSLGEKAFAAMFHSVSARTAGFSTVEFAALTPAAAFFITALMFIGTASASTGGGIRLNTVGVLAATVLASIRSREQVTLFHREIPPTQVHRALAVAVLAITLVFFVAFFLTFTEKKEFINLFFETVSAFGTVGLSAGVTPELSLSGQLVIILTMLIGRLGPLTLALALANREQSPPLYRFAEERVKIG